MKKYDCYISAPFFTEEQRNRISEVVARLRALNFKVYVPMEHKVNNAYFLDNKVWGKTVFEEDIKAIKESRKILTLFNIYGITEDGGTAWEIGYAYALGIPVWGLPMDNKTKDKDYLASLMIINSLVNVDKFDYIEQK